MGPDAITRGLNYPCDILEQNTEKFKRIKALCTVATYGDMSMTDAIRKISAIVEFC